MLTVKRHRKSDEITCILKISGRLDWYPDTWDAIDQTIDLIKKIDTKNIVLDVKEVTAFGGNKESWYFLTKLKNKVLLENGSLVLVSTPKCMEGLRSCTQKNNPDYSFGPICQYSDSIEGAEKLLNKDSKSSKLHAIQNKLVDESKYKLLMLVNTKLSKNDRLWINLCGQSYFDSIQNRLISILPLVPEETVISIERTYDVFVSWDLQFQSVIYKFRKHKKKLIFFEDRDLFRSHSSQDIGTAKKYKEI